MNNIAIIPARGGSKRIPLKNIKEFCGKPIIAYSIEAARATELFSRVIVSTDDEEIAAVARKYGAEVPFMRPAELSGDQIGIQPVMQQALDWLREQGEYVDNICLIMATAPLLQPKYLVDAFNLMADSGAAGATAVTTFPSCIFRALRINESGALEMLWPDNFAKRSQDFPEMFHDAAQFTWSRVEEFSTQPDKYPRNIIPLILPRHQVQDIDTLEDWVMAEQLYNVGLMQTRQDQQEGIK